MVDRKSSSPGGCNSPSYPKPFRGQQEPNVPIEVSNSKNLESDSAVHLQGLNGSIHSVHSENGRHTSLHNVSSPTPGWGKHPDTLLPVGPSLGDLVRSVSGKTETYLDSPAASEDNRNETFGGEDRDALRPDPGTEHTFEVEDNKFAFSPGQLTKLYNPKSLGAFHALGGLLGLERGLRTDLNHGLDLEEELLDGYVSFEDATTPSDAGYDRRDPLERTATSNPSRIPLLREVPGYLGGREMSAFPDSGSSYNLISESLAAKLGARINSSEKRSVALPKGKTEILGTVTLPFEFYDERQPHPLVFHVIKKCFQGCILGADFLKKTETLGKHFSRRVRQKLVSPSKLLRFNLVDGPQERLRGTLNGQLVGALADTGASVNVMSRSTAKQLGLKIFQRKKHTTRLAFVDGSVASTSGMVFGVEWKFGNNDASLAHRLDFHILDRLPCHVVLGEDVLYDNDVFSRYQDYFYNETSSAHGKKKIDLLGLIINIGREGSPPVLVMEEEELQELHRRSAVEDEIAELPVSEQAAARAAEDRQREGWDRNRPAGAAGNATPASAGTQTAQTSAESNGTQTAQTPATQGPPLRRRFRILSLRRFRRTGHQANSAASTLPL